MKIAELTAFHVRIPLKRTIKHASHVRTETDNIVVRCVLSDRSVGFGEGLPRDYVTGETIESVVALLRRSDFAAQVVPCRRFDEAVTFAESIRLAPIAGDERGCQGNAARCAVELAILDAYGHAFGEPLSHVTRQIAPELYQPRERIQYSAIITTARGLRARAIAAAYRIYGFRQIKVKVGLSDQLDPRRVRAIRRWAGRSMDLRVDANEAWKPEHASDRIRDLEPYGITSVEQPLAHEDFEHLPELRSRIATPIMLDESLCSMWDAERAVNLRACDLFNIRLSKCGGFIPSLRLAQFAKRHGLGYQLGCQVGESAILSAAGRAFAGSVRDLRAVEGSYDRHLVRANLSTKDLTFRRGGFAPLLVDSGSGFAIDEIALQAATVAKESLIG